jgi:hypothetical protein
MSEYRAHLRALADSLPDGTVIPCPVEWIRDLVGNEPAAAPLTVDLTLAKVAELLSRKQSTIRGWANQGLFPNAYKLHGKAWYFPAESVRAFQEKERNRNGGTASLGGWRKQKPSTQRRVS